MKKFAKDQGDRNLDFNGQEGGVSYKQNKQYAYNHHSGTANDGALVNKGRGPTKGNTDTTAHQGRRPPVDGVKPPFANPDKINVGRGPRNPGGTREAKCPANPDKQNVGRGPTKGNSQ